MRKLIILSALSALLSLSGLVVACGDDDDGGSEADKQEVSDTVKQVAEAGPEEFDYYVEHVTDNLIASFFGGTREDCVAAPDDCVGDPLTDVTVDRVTIDGDAATAEITGTSDGDTERFGVRVIKDADVWKVDGLLAPNDEVPDGVDLVDLELAEFAFIFEEDSDAVKSGNFAFHVTNIGEQPHMVNLIQFPEDADLQEIIQSLTESGESPEGVTVTDIAIRLPYNPGDEATDFAFGELDPGRYALLCFFPNTDDPEGPDHVSLGMSAEFTVE